MIWKFSFLFFFLFSLIVFQSCKKDSSETGPISFTDKDGNLFIPIDTATWSFDAYSHSDQSVGRLFGIFNDTIRSSFRLAITTKPYWDTIYHGRDTVIFPNFYPSHSISFAADVDLTGFQSPYHFLLLGIPHSMVISGSHGKPSLRLTISNNN